MQLNKLGIALSVFAVAIFNHHGNSACGQEIPERYSAFFDALEGQFDMSLKLTPKGAPSTLPGKGSIDRQWIMDHSFLESNSEVTVMGMRVKKRIVFGYDPVREKLTMVTFDGRTKQTLFATGDLNENKNEAVFTRERPQKDVDDLRVKTIYRFEDDATMTMEEYWTTSDESRLNMKITFTPKK